MNRKRGKISFTPFTPAVHFTGFRCSNGSIYDQQTYGQGGYELICGDEMYDELLPRSDKRTRNCRHRSINWRGYMIDHLYGNRNNPTTYYVLYENRTVSPYSLPHLAYLLSPDWSDTSIIGDMEAFNSRAYEAMLPSLEQDVSLTNFLLELGDLKDIISLFSRTASVLKKLSEGHLTWSFGIAPFVGDIQKVWSSLVNYERIIQDFLDRAKVPQKRYYREFDDLSDPSEAWVVGTYTDVRKPYVLKVTRHATMSYTYDVSDIITLRDKLRAMRDILGLRLTPSVIWEAIPFSFVVDWFLNVGDFLKSRENALIEPNVLITDYSVSVKVETSGTWDWRAPEPCNTAVNFAERFADYNGKLYWRKRCLPNTSGNPLTLSLPGSNQLALAFSLVNVSRK